MAEAVRMVSEASNDGQAAALASGISTSPESARATAANAIVKYRMPQLPIPHAHNRMPSSGEAPVRIEPGMTVTHSSIDNEWNPLDRGIAAKH